MSEVIRLFLRLTIFCYLGSGVLTCGYTQKQEAQQTAKNELATPHIPEHHDFSNPQKIMNSVGERYSKIEYYRLNGSSERESVFDGQLTIPTKIPFEIEYRRGSSTTISWKDRDRVKIFKIGEGKSWIEVDGKIDRRFANPKEGLGSITRAEDGLSIFLLDVFVFRDELGMGDRFFIGLKNSRVERESEIDGRRCYLLVGDFEGVEASMTYWIDAESYLIRRIERELVVRKTVGPKEYVSRTTTRETYENIEIEP